MTTLKAQAEKLGIEVNGRWSDDTLQKKIDEAKAEKGANFGGKGDHDGDGKDGGAAPSQAAIAGAPVADDGTELKTEATPKAAKATVTIDAKTRLIITAEELNIVVDENWDEARLRGEIQMALEGRADLQVKGAIPPAEYGKVDFDPATQGDKTTYTLQTDYWDKDGERVPAGTDVAFTDTEARRLGSNVLKPKSVLG